MQIAYFDESGIDGAHDVTLISGVVARLDDWPRINAAWRGQLAHEGIGCFHYIDCRNQRGEYRGWDWFSRCVPHLDHFANIFSASPVGGVSAATLGPWKESVTNRPDLHERFPSAYAFCFEMIITKIRREMHHHGQPDIVLVFANQNQYQKRAIEIWQWHRDRGAWPEIKDVRYAEPRDVPGLQMADMLAWETRRHLHKGGEEWKTLPLLKRLIAKQQETGHALYEIAYQTNKLQDVRRVD